MTDENKATLQGGSSKKRNGNYKSKKLVNPRQQRVLTKLLSGETTVRALFDVAGNNPAETIAQLRRLGLIIELEWVRGVDQDGRRIRYGVYSLGSQSGDLARSLIGGD